MTTNSKELINTDCIICGAATKIVKKRSHLCPTCKANLVYIMRHKEDSITNLMDLKIRYLAVRQFQKNPKIGITDALRRAIKIIKQGA